MFKTIAALSLLLLFMSGCSDKHAYAPDEKVYQGEDLDILLGIEAAKSGDLNSSINFFQKLYDKTEKFEYFSEMVKLQVEAKQYERARKNILNHEKKDITLQRLVAISYIRQNNFDKALKIAIANTKVSNNSLDYRLVSDIYLTIGEYENAFKYLQSAYAKDPSIHNLLPMVRVLTSYLDKESDALAYLQTYSKTHGFNEKIYTQILAIHSKNENIEGMKSALQKLYKNTKKDEYAQNLLNIYSYLNDTQGAIEFLKNSSYKPNLLFDMYKSSNKYAKALELAKIQYEATKSPNWLANTAILEYELDYPLPQIVQTFEKALEQGEDGAIYLNYFGYILIDHEIDIPKGVELVKKALKQQPDSIYYIDSLAWGYYKLKKCEKAKEYLRILSKDKSPEIQEHVKKIKRCND